MTEEAKDVIAVVAFAVVIAAIVFATGVGAGRSQVCADMGAEYHKGKCVVVERKEVKL